MNVRFGFGSGAPGHGITVISCGIVISVTAYVTRSLVCHAIHASYEISEDVTVR